MTGPSISARRPHPAAGDGERLRPGPIAQPVNTLSSVAYLVAAARLLRPAGRRSPLRIALAVAVGANGVGSMGFHGPGDRWSHRLHDVSLWTIVGLLAADLGTTALRDHRQLRRRIGPLAVLGAGAVLNRLTGTGAPWHRPDSLLQGHAGWHLLSAAALARWGSRLTAPGRRTAGPA